MIQSESVEFRFATLKDIEQLTQLRFSMQSEVNAGNALEAPREYLEIVADYFQTGLNNKTYFCSVAVSGERIIGTAGVCFYQKPPSLSGGTGLVGYVTNVYVVESLRGNGIGKQLMLQLNHLAEKMRAGKLHLGATSDGLGVYRSVGYVDPKYVNLEIRFPNK